MIAPTFWDFIGRSSDELAAMGVARSRVVEQRFAATGHARHSIADAQRQHRFLFHHGVRVVSHEHLSLTPVAPNVCEILRRAHHDMSCALNTLLAHERYDAPRNIFDARQPHMMRLLDAAAQASHLTYEYLNPVAAGLVARPEHMPGTMIDWGHWKSGGIVVRRPEVYFGSDRPEELQLELTPPPLLLHAFDGDTDALVHHMRRLSEEGNRALRDARGGREPLDAQKLRRMHPWNEPKTLAAPGGHLVPTFKIGARGLVGRRMDGDARREVTGFREEHEVARRGRLAGQNPVFPHGTYAMRVFHNAPVAEPTEDAIVAKPGPLLDEVLAMLEDKSPRSEHDPACAPAHVAIVEQTREAWRDEAAEVAELNLLDFEGVDVKSKPTAPAAPPDTEPRPEPKVRHRFDRELDRGGEHPRRLITKRDRRRGRPVGADPPE